MVRFKEKEIKQIINGDNEPLKRIFQECFDDGTSQVMRSMSCSKADAEDVLMDSFLVLRDKILEGEFVNENVKAYLITVAKNKWRNKSKRDRRLIEFDPKKIEQKLNHTVDGIPNEEEIRIKQIIEAIESLSGNCQELLTENLLNGIPLKALTEKLAYSSYDVIKTTKSRCMKKLRALFKNNNS